MTKARLCNNIVITMQVQTVFKAGNSDVVALPKELGFKKGDRVIVEKASENEVLVKKVNSKKTKATASKTEFDRWLKVFVDENGEILDELAER